VLGLLTRLGWRPAGRGPLTISRYWEKLASVASEPIERHQWLVVG